jgi:hypothetical protein
LVQVGSGSTTSKVAEGGAEGGVMMGGGDLRQSRKFTESRNYGNKNIDAPPSPYLAGESGPETSSHWSPVYCRLR